ncbi:MAG: PH domain-containing protein [Propionibacteriales bacterium]|nr:PH domain-containing protein [Propionibacteriales bacterium]
MVFRPQGPRIVAYGVAVILIVLTVAVRAALPQEIRDQFTTFEMLTLAAVLGSTLVGLYAVARSFVKVSDTGLHIRNGYRDRHLAWGDIHGVSFRPGAPWPTLVTSDGERVILFAIQGTDGPAARSAVDTIRERLA